MLRAELVETFAGADVALLKRRVPSRARSREREALPTRRSAGPASCSGRPRVNAWEASSHQARESPPSMATNLSMALHTRLIGAHDRRASLKGSEDGE